MNDLSVRVHVGRAVQVESGQDYRPSIPVVRGHFVESDCTLVEVEQELLLPVGGRQLTDELSARMEINRIRSCKLLLHGQ